MLRFYVSIFLNFFHLWLIPYMQYVHKHYDDYTPEYKFSLVQRVVRHVTNASNVNTTYHGVENIPDTGNFIIYPNHEGKYDTIALLSPFKKPLSIVMDYKRSFMVLCDEVMNMVDGKRMKRDDVRQALTIMNEVTEELKQGRSFIIFPEGGYLLDKGNHLFQFKPGAFKCALKAHSTIVPTVMYNIYKVYEKNNLRHQENDIYFLDPIYYDEYKGLNTQELAALVRERIAKKIAELDGISVEEVYRDIPEGTVLI